MLRKPPLCKLKVESEPLYVASNRKPKNMFLGVQRELHPGALAATDAVLRTNNAA
jgi:hypothetical protein